ncbi:MAG: hypothetical protein ACR2F6_14525 [Mycobacteriales bacterium]
MADPSLDLLTDVHDLGEMAFPDVFASVCSTGTDSVAISVASDDLTAFKSYLPADGHNAFRRVAHSFGELEHVAGQIIDDPDFRDRISRTGPDEKTNNVQVVLIAPYSPTVARAIIARYGADMVEVSRPAEQPAQGS